MAMFLLVIVILVIGVLFILKNRNIGGNQNDVRSRRSLSATATAVEKTRRKTDEEPPKKEAESPKASENYAQIVFAEPEITEKATPSDTESKVKVENPQPLDIPSVQSEESNNLVIRRDSPTPDVGTARDPTLRQHSPTRDVGTARSPSVRLVLTPMSETINLVVEEPKVLPLPKEETKPEEQNAEIKTAIKSSDIKSTDSSAPDKSTSNTAAEPTATAAAAKKPKKKKKRNSKTKSSNIGDKNKKKKKSKSKRGEKSSETKSSQNP